MLSFGLLGGDLGGVKSECLGASLCLTVGNNGADLYGFDSAEGYGAISPTTFLGLPIYSFEADVATSHVYAKMGAAGDSQIPNVPSMFWDVKGYGQVEFTWDTTFLDYDTDDVGLAAFIQGRAGEKIGFNVDPQIVFNPITDSPDWSLVAGNAAPLCKESDGVVVFAGTTNPDSMIAYGTETFADGYIEATILYQAPSNSYASFPLSLRMSGGTSFLGMRVYDNDLQVWGRIGNAFQQVLIVPAPAETGYVCRLEAIGTNVNLYVDGTLVGSGTTTHTASGGAGIIARSSPTVAVANAYNVVSLEANMFVNGEFDGTIDPWVNSVADHFKMNATNNGVTSDAIAPSGGAFLTQDMDLIAGNSYSMYGIVDTQTAPANWFFEEIIQTEEFGTDAIFIASATGTFACGIAVNQDIGIDFDSMVLIDLGVVATYVVDDNGNQVVDDNGNKVVL